jgi:hypothetical protein
LASFESTPLQEGQTKTNCSGRIPSFSIVREYFMVSPHEMHSMVGVLSDRAGGRSLAGIKGVKYVMCDSTETGGSAIELSATNAWHGAAVGDEAYVRLIRTVARLSFRQNARNLDSANGGNIQKSWAGSALQVGESSKLLFEWNALPRLRN